MPEGEDTGLAEAAVGQAGIGVREAFAATARALGCGMPDLTWYFASGRAADVMLALLALELVWLWRVRGSALLTAFAVVAPGALIVLGLRGALTGAAWPLVALPLALALPAHLLDLARRPPGGRRASDQAY